MTQSFDSGEHPLYTILSVTWFSAKCNKAHKSRLK